MAIQSVSNFPEDHDPFAPFYFADYAAIQQRRRELRRARMMKHAGAAAFIVFAATIGFFMSTEPAQAQSVECMACLTDPANDLPATKGDVYAIDVKTQDNAERIAQEIHALEAMINVAEARTARRIEDVAALAGVADARALETVRADIGSLDGKIDDVDRSSKQRDAAILAIPDLGFGLGDRYAVNVAIGSAGGENAVGLAAGTRIPFGSGALHVRAGAGTDTSGDEVVGRVSFGASW